ncbi:hypothetical protein [Streptomyces sp. NPDC047985]|uniref:hypothetical protein n=1 Tax=unclassified Streptomyces TaxID=2593676 RepID=UPI00342042A3
MPSTTDNGVRVRAGATAPFPWQNDPRHTVAHMVAWVNAELMKNAAEIGQLRLQRVADGPSATHRT